MTVAPATLDDLTADERRRVSRIGRKLKRWQEQADALHFVDPPSPELAQYRLLEFIRLRHSWFLPGMFHRELCTALDRFSRDVFERKSPRLLICAPPRHGKALEVSTPIPTPDGWKAIGDLRAGDLVFDDRGAPTKVVAVSEVWRDRELFEVATDEGETLLADAAHEWVVRLCRKHKAVTVRTTAYLAARTSNRAPLVVRAPSFDLPDADLPIEPWALGAWLGDGNTDHATMSAAEVDSPHMRSQFEAAGYGTTDRATYATFGVVRGPDQTLGLQADLRDGGVLGNKHIPPAYLRASHRQRLALLQGLIDTDGHVAPDGQVEFCTTLECLGASVLELVRSLGAKAFMVHGRATINGVDHGPKYRVMFYLANAARMPRKAARCRDAAKSPGHYITVKPTGRKGDTVCIQVAADSSMFLAGPGMLATHNSQIVSRDFPVYHLIRCPTHEVIVSSYGQEFANDLSRDARAVRDGVKKTWPHLEPGDRDGIENWRIRGGGSYFAVGAGGPLTGRGMNCFPAGTMVSTPSGDRPIESMEPGDLVWSYDGPRGMLASRVKATCRSPAHEFAEVRFASGRVVRSTPDHRFFVRGRGYTAAEDLRVGDPVCVAPESVSVVRRAHIEARGDVQALLREGSAGRRGDGLRVLSGSGSEEGVRDPQGAQEGARRRVLLRDVRAVASRCEELPPMHRVRHPVPEEDDEVLFSRLSSGTLGDTSRLSGTSVPGVREPVHATGSASVVLLEAVCEQGALRENAGRRELVAPGRGQRDEAVQRDPAVRGDTRRGAVPGLLGDGEPARSPHRRGSGEQRAREPDHAVLALPRPAPQVGTDAVSVVLRLRDRSEPVYDIEVDDTHCFFANGALVHNCGIIDDPIKNFAESRSETVRRARWEWYASTFYTRLMPGGGILAMQTRWHEQDPAGMMLEQKRLGTENWTVINFPAIADHDEYNDRGMLLRRRGDPLHAERYDLEALARIRGVTPSRMWSALYQQSPTPDEGSVFERDWLEHRYLHDPQRPPEPYDEIIVSIDATLNDAATSDFVAMVVVGRKGMARFDVLDEVHDRMSYIGLRTAAQDLIAKWRPNVVLIERAASGHALIDELKREFPAVVGFTPSEFGSKDTRAIMVTPLFEAGNVRFPKEGRFTSDFVEELASFPSGAHDDRVDALGQALIYFTKRLKGTQETKKLVAGLQGVMDRLRR